MNCKDCAHWYPIRAYIGEDAPHGICMRLSHADLSSQQYVDEPVENRQVRLTYTRNFFGCNQFLVKSEPDK